MSARKGSAWGARILPLLPGDIVAENLGGGFYQLDFPFITDINGTVTSNFEVPFPHKIAALYIKHTDPNGDDESTDSLTFSAKFGLKAGIQPFSMASFNLSTNPDEHFTFQGNEAARNACLYTFETTETVADNLVYVSMIVQALGEI